VRTALAAAVPAAQLPTAGGSRALALREHATAAATVHLAVRRAACASGSRAAINRTALRPRLADCWVWSHVFPATAAGDAAPAGSASSCSRTRRPKLSVQLWGSRATFAPSGIFVERYHTQVNFSYS